MSITNIKSGPLNQKVFKENIDYSIFESILDTLDGISPKFVSREQFNNKKGDILNDKFGKKYTLFLPSDLKIHELPSIIYKINKLSFPGQVPEYASINELKIKITLAIDLLLSELKTKKTDKQKIKKAIKNYIRLYSQMFPDEDASLLNNADYRKSIMETKNRKKHEKFAKKLQQIKTKENLSDLQEELDKLLSTEIGIHFEESLYERGLNKLSMGLMSITQAELDNIRKNNSNPKDKTVERIDKDKLDKKEQLLRSKIGIEQFKKELDNIRAIGNIEEIAKKELEITNIILEILHEFPYQLTEKNYGYQPKEILKNKEIYCVGFSLIGSSFLNELGIEHKGLELPGHSALEVLIGGKKYYFDATAFTKAIEFTYGNKLGKYSEINLKTKSENKNENNIFVELYNKFFASNEKEQLDDSTIDVKIISGLKKLLAISGNPEKILFSQIYNNRGVDLVNDKDFKGALKIYEKALKLNPNSSEIYYNLGIIYSRLGDNNQAIKMSKISIKLNPDSASGYKSLGNYYYDNGNYKESELQLSKALRKNYKDTEIHNFMGLTLMKLGKNEEAVKILQIATQLKPNNKMYERNLSNAITKLGADLSDKGKHIEAIKKIDSAIQLNPINSSAYREKYITLSKLGNHKAAILNRYVATNLNYYKQLLIRRSYSRSSRKTSNLQSLYKKEKTQIDYYLQKGNYDSLRKYMLMLSS